MDAFPYSFCSFIEKNFARFYINNIWLQCKHKLQESNLKNPQIQKGGETRGDMVGGGIPNWGSTINHTIMHCKKSPQIKLKMKKKKNPQILAPDIFANILTDSVKTHELGLTHTISYSKM